MEIDIVIDVVCPWCFIGKRQLDKAVAQRPGLVKDVRFRAYQLSPDTPDEGVDRAAYYARKFGADNPQLEAARAHFAKVGPALGIDFLDWQGDVRIANTMDAHRLLLWSAHPGKQSEVADLLMQAYFERGAFLGDHALLTDIARHVGMDADLVGDLLASDRDTGRIRESTGNAHRAGITGVPFFIFDGEHGVPGAQDADRLLAIMDKLSGRLASAEQADANA